MYNGKTKAKWNIENPNMVHFVWNLTFKFADFGMQVST